MEFFNQKIRKIYLKRKLRSANIKVNSNIFDYKHTIKLEENCNIGNVKLVGNSNHSFQCGAFSYHRSGVCIGTVEIGRFCSISNDITIGLEKNGHPLNWLSTSPFQYSKNQITNNRKPDHLVYEPSLETTTIGHDVWIGTRVIIYNGCKVGTGAVIAAGSIVTKDVPSYAIIAGCPAKIVRYRFPPHIVNDLIKSEWWQLQPDFLSDISFNCQSDFLEELKSIKKNHHQYTTVRISKNKLTIQSAPSTLHSADLSEDD